MKPSFWARLFGSRYEVHRGGNPSLAIQADTSEYLRFQGHTWERINGGEWIERKEKE